MPVHKLFIPLALGASVLVGTPVSATPTPHATATPCVIITPTPTPPPTPVPASLPPSVQTAIAGTRPR